MTPQGAQWLRWELDSHFIRYVQGLPDGVCQAQSPAEHAGDVFIFPEDGSGRKQFSGAIRFEGHGGLLDVLLQDPSIESDENGSTLRVSGPSGRTTMLDLRKIDSKTGTVFESTLRGEALQWFGGVYLPGRPFGLVGIHRHS